MIALLDGDIVAYRCAAAAEKDSVEEAVVTTDKMMTNIINAVEAIEYKCFISGKDNFRKTIYPAYKENRKDTIRPTHLEACRQFLISEWNAVECHGAEADDYLGIHQDKEGKDGVYETVICSIDKDLLQIPGYHYNFVKQQYQEVSYLQGIKHFYKQMLIGDVADNIKGIKGIGAVGAGKFIDLLPSEFEMLLTVCNFYKDDPDKFQTNADCLWIWRKENEMFTDRKVR